MLAVRTSCILMTHDFRIDGATIFFKVSNSTIFLKYQIAQFKFRISVVYLLQYHIKINEN